MSDDNIKVFSTSAQESESVPAGDDVTVRIDDETVTFLAPTTSHIILMASMLEGAKDEKRRASIIINWFFSMLDPMQRGYFETRLFDHKDAFDLTNISAIVDHLMEQWSARPTQRSSTSSGSPRTGGKKSTGKRHGQAQHRGRSTSDSGAPSSTGGAAEAPAMKAVASSAP